MASKVSDDCGHSARSTAGNPQPAAWTSTSHDDESAVLFPDSANLDGTCDVDDDATPDEHVGSDTFIHISIVMCSELYSDPGGGSCGQG